MGWDLAVVIQDPALRLFIRAIVEMVCPQLHVLSQEEALATESEGS
jgi:flagellar biosynthesis component FlhA